MKNYFLILLAMVFLSSCYNDKIQELYPSSPSTSCDTSAVTYSGTILPIIRANCSVSGCHPVGDPSHYDFNTNNGYDGVKLSVTNNRLLGAINHTYGYLPMPQTGGSISTCQINQFVAWINKGAPNN